MTFESKRPVLAPTQIHGLTVNAATTARADLSLEIGESRQVIEVEAAAVQLNSEDSKSSVTINQKLVILCLSSSARCAVPSTLQPSRLNQECQRRRRLFSWRRPGSQLRCDSRWRLRYHITRPAKELGFLQCAIGRSAHRVHG